MVVQTLVENAIKYGVSKHQQTGDVQISARVENGMVEIQVANAGTLATETNGTGVGLRNAAERIHRLWGDDASLWLAEDPPGRVVATLRIPR